MTADEHRAYARGYAAGRKKVKQSRTAENLRRERQAFHDKAFLAALPFAFEQTTWTRGEAPIKTLNERVKLAQEIADVALKARRCVV